MSITKQVETRYWKLRQERAKIQARYRWAIGRDGAKYDLANAKLLTFIDNNWDKLESAGLVRCRIVPDECCDIEDLKGDTYNVELNADTVPGGKRTIEAQEKAFMELIERDGVWGFVIEYRKPACGTCGRKADWEHVDSCWGFVGEIEESEMWHGKAEAIRLALNA